MKFSELFRKKSDINEKDLKWNRFIDTIYGKKIGSMPEKMYIAAICFKYDTEMYQGGHSGFFEYHPEIKPQELASALEIVASKTLADNFRNAAAFGKSDEYNQADRVFLMHVPPLTQYIREYFEAHENEILK